MTDQEHIYRRSVLMKGVDRTYRQALSEIDPTDPIGETVEDHERYLRRTNGEYADAWKAVERFDRLLPDYSRIMHPR